MRAEKCPKSNAGVLFLSNEMQEFTLCFKHVCVFKADVNESDWK